ncbi:MAG: glycosyltransferase [Bacteroidales bacterium]|nr:glycosyltransferase [Bacteroidales bacterium]
MKYSLIIPVYNRPDEVSELLASIASQPFRDFEVLVVEDGSSVKCEDIVNQYAEKLDIKYLFKENGGPAMARNYAAERAEGEYLLILDSDTVLPEGYFEAIESFLSDNTPDAFGGPDRGGEDFTPVQKAISYSMTSFFTTGGIRGGKRKITRFFPRSFNMGVRREVFAKLGGFSAMRFGEDVDFSMRVVEAGFTTALIPDAWLYHKRRTDFRKFFRQVRNSGKARISLTRRHPGSLRLVHLFPLGFVVLSLILPFDVLYALLVFADSTIKNKSPKVGLLSVVAAYVQLWGYGIGFIAGLFSKEEANIDNDRFYR